MENGDLAGFALLGRAGGISAAIAAAELFRLGHKYAYVPARAGGARATGCKQFQL
jgi:hypothetical protein